MSLPLVCVGPAASRHTPATCGTHGECDPKKRCVDPVDDAQQCDCRCGCVAHNTSTASAPRPANQHIGGLPLSSQGATIYHTPGGGEPKTKAADAPPSLGLCAPPPSPTDMIPWPAVSRASAAEQAFTCSCKARGAGIPACNDQYPTPSNATLQRFASQAAKVPALMSGGNVTIFGDSITWLGGYIDQMRDALRAQGVAAGFVNRGINGGTVKDLRDGSTKCGQTKPGIDTVLAEDSPVMVNFMIGINDVWFHGANASTYVVILSDLVRRAQAVGAKVAVSTVSVIGEKTDGSQAHDTQLALFAEAAANVSRATGAALSEVHTAYHEYEQDYNTLPAGGGLANGILTIDGVHPCMGGENSCPQHTHGNTLLANVISGGLLQLIS